MSKVATALSMAGVGGTGAAAITTAHYMGAFGDGYGGMYIDPALNGLKSYNGGCIDHTFP